MDNFSTLTTMASGKKKVKKAVIQDKGHKNEMKMFIETIRDHKSTPIPFESLQATTLACFKIHESIARNEMVALFA